MSKTLFAAFVGINNYPTNPLYGCVKDVTGMHAFLDDFVRQQGNMRYAPAFWLAPHADEQDGLPKHQSPTFKNLSDRQNGPFGHLKNAKSGDICLLYYSGHGSYMDAPEVFWHSKADHRNETLVCVDSRSNAEARDLIDKELAFLIHDALRDPNTGQQKKDVHCVVIMDCCHAGNNMRSTEQSAQQLRYRHAPGGKTSIPLGQYIGATDKFFVIKDGKATFEEAQYVHLAAALASEKAQESPDKGGLFSAALLENLRAGGSGKSYRQLMDSLTVSVSNRAEQQHPVPAAKVDADLDIRFLGDGLVPYTPTFEVRYDPAHAEWLLHGGAQDMVTPSGAHAKTLIRLEGEVKDVKVVEVFSKYSYLDAADMAAYDKGTQYKATLRQRANARLKIGISDALRAENTLLAALRAAVGSAQLLYCEVDFDEKNTAVPDYVVRITDGGEYALCKPDGQYPVFKREADAVSFLKNVDAVGKWVSASELKNESPAFRMEDFVFTLEKIEGQVFKSMAALEAIEVGADAIVTGALPAEQALYYSPEGRQPAFRLRVALAPNQTRIQKCHVGAMYLTSTFGIVPDLVSLDSNVLEKGKGGIDLSVEGNNVRYKSIPLKLDDAYKAYNINEIAAYLKVVVSNETLDLKRYGQKSLKLDDEPNRTVRSMDSELSLEDNLGDQTEWSVFTMKIRIVGPNKALELSAAQPADFAAFTVTVPEGFAGTAYALTSADQESKARQALSRGMDNKAAALASPPQSIWGDTETDDVPFEKGANPSAGNDVQALEIAVEDGQMLTIPAGQSIQISPKAGLARTRSADNAETVTIPFGYDEERGIYLPLGYQDKHGNIQVTHLPPPSSGLLQDAGPNKRSVKSSLKLYFKKIRRERGQAYNELVLHHVDAQGNWQKVTDAASIKGMMQGKKNAVTVMVIHGIIGDTLGQVAGMQQLCREGMVLDFLLSYDYENLGNKITITAQQLHKQLLSIGYDKAAEMPKISIVAHSMGGLVSRFLIENEGGDQYVKKLIQVGTPNAGSDIPDKRGYVYDMLTHAMNANWQAKLAIKGLSFLLTKLDLNPLETFADLAPGSDMMKKLAGTPMSGKVPYALVAGNTSLIDQHDTEAPYLKRILQALKEGAYWGWSKAMFKDKPNDIACTVESMRTVPNLPAKNVKEVACDHISYFGDGPTLAEIRKALVMMNDK
jgi:hypothetical protein